MYTNDSETLRHFADALEINPRIVALPHESALHTAKIDIARCYFSWNWRSGAVVEDIQNFFDTGTEYIPLFLLLDSVNRHAHMTVNYAAFELLKEGRLHGLLVYLDRESIHFASDGISFEANDGLKSEIVPLVRADQTLKTLAVDHDRPCGRRDHLWLEWKDTLGLTPAKIRDKWNRMSDKERGEIAPKCRRQVTDGTPGCDTVKKGVDKAESELISTQIPPRDASQN